ncbi:TRAM domain-containing protein [Janthinobacterium fluminis]|uniref:tRNA-2-methylthio-N(6)-dimethylallyladenosine synthase n=1 Tax=Janthinobacterium fluminis TaxID=2987524 RepID=A0ABT5K4V8_9BURK|nr:TRAM domain-containing protein [Janthinobacterium fluminis]MDC8758787.1 TRAM domain-containing protein [Janthinobacterium fluminis]
MQKKVFIKTFGCQMNEYDSDKMADVLGGADGMVRTDTAEDADVILLNTCSVREKAQEKVFSDLGRLHQLKLAKPELLIGVGGCVASQEGAAIVRRAPYVDMVFGPQTLHRLPQMSAARRGGAANTRRHSLAMVGSVQRVLVEGPAKKDPGDLQGRSENNRVVNFAGGADAPRLVGQLVDVRITASHSYTLRGELVAATSETKRAS